MAHRDNAVDCRHWRNTPILILIVILSTSLILSTAEKVFYDTRQDEFARSLDGYEIITPAKFHADSGHLSHSVTHRLQPETQRRKRSAPILEPETGSPDDGDDVVHYKLTLEGVERHLVLVPSDDLFAPGLVVERRRSRAADDRAGGHGDAHAERITHNRCQFKGKVKGQPRSLVAISTCDGLLGYIHTGDRDYFIEPVKRFNSSSFVGHPHLVYRRSALPPNLLPPAAAASAADGKSQAKTKRQDGTCGVTEDQAKDGERERGPAASEPRGGRSRRRRRSVSLERHVETLVVVDRHMMDYHSNENVENYVLTIMNMVMNMYHDATIGNAINIQLVRIMYLEEDKKELVIQTHADHTLSSFCAWQNSINMKNDTHPNHHDVAILLTRLDICSRSNEPCSTLGLSQVSGMCQPHRSCNINQDTGLALAFTITHELGHNFGMQHDTAENGCDPTEHGMQYIMAPQLTAEASPLVWSSCSRRAITSFLDRDWGYCLEDEPEDHDEFVFPVLPAGVMYDLDHQCRLQYGPDASFCDGIDEPCVTLWCRVESRCITRMETAAAGTLRPDNTWCFGGKRVTIDERPLAIDGHWGQWGSWSECTRTCGGGISHSERLCGNPQPSHGGRYCIGERKRFRTCNTDSCPENMPSFREKQCSDFNDVPYRGQTYEWEPLTNTATPCQLHCKPKGRFFSVMLKDMVIDGTPCKTGRHDMCISGRCRVIGCDWGIETDAVEDSCGFCHGDGSGCKKITENFDKISGSGYVEATIIPEGARNIRVEEVAEANNFLAIRNDRGEYYLNGHWYIQWSGDYELAGTVVEYRREGNKETIFTPGPIKEPLHLMLLFQSQNPGIVLEYTVINENATGERRQEFLWKFMDWTHCTASCGGGTQTSKVICVERENGHVEDRYCNASTRPDDMHKTCNDHLCPARWWFGPWQHCSVSCGNGGVRRRTVLCIRKRGQDEQIALDDAECEGVAKPPQASACEDREPCPVEESPWKIGPWSSQVCVTDACAVQRRTVECVAELGFCDSSKMPPTEKPCPQALCGRWTTGAWSQCSRTCGSGVQVRSVVCTGGRSCPQNSEPPTEQDCNTHSCVETNEIPQTVQSVTPGNAIFPIAGRQPLADLATSMLSSTTATRPITYRWMSRLWSDCSKPCGKGLRTRRVVCVIAHTSTAVAEELCSGLRKPTTNDTCEKEPCITWTVTAWRSCSATCGEGLQQRSVSCAMPDLCDIDDKPIDRRICSAAPCVEWTTSPWQECSQTCGSGTRHRNVTCVNTITRQQVTSGCNATVQPPAVQICTLAECPSIADASLHSRSEPCHRNFLTDRMCEMVQSQGKCSSNLIQRKCCKTCQQAAILSRSRGES